MIPGTVFAGGAARKLPEYPMEIFIGFKAAVRGKASYGAGGIVQSVADCLNAKLIDIVLWRFLKSLAKDAENIALRNMKNVYRYRKREFLPSFYVLHFWKKEQRCVPGHYIRCHEF